MIGEGVHPSQSVTLKRHIEALRHLKALGRDSRLRFLGYFAVLEALLTHAPDPKDPYDSITRQVKKKIALLNNQWPDSLDYTPFAGIPPDKLWTRMYSYRSAIAHGDEPNLSSGELTVLKNHETALRLLVNTVKAVMRYALDEPLLLRDLRDC